MAKLAPKTVNHQNRSVQRILDAALVVWSRDGYHGSSLKDIADQAGVAKSLLHYHFASKEHLLVELQAVHCRTLAEAVRARLERRRPSLATALGALDQVWEAIVRTRRQLPFVLEVWRASQHNPALHRRLVDFDREMTGLVCDGMVRSLGPLVERSALPPARLAAILQVALAGFALRLLETDDTARVRRTFDDFKLLVGAALISFPGKHPSKGGAR